MGKTGRMAAPVLLLAALLLGGCVLRDGPPVSTRPTPTPEPVTAASLLEDVNDELLAAGGVKTRVRGHMAYRLSARDGERDTRAELALEAESSSSGPDFHAAGTAAMEVQGIAMELPVELYALEGESGAVLYVKVLDEWLRSSTPRSGPASETGGLWGSELLRAAARLSPEPESLEGRSCWRLEFPITAEMLAQAGGGLALAVPESGPALRAVLWVEEESRRPLRCALTLTAPLESPELSLRELALEIDYTDFGPVGSLTPPPEALNAREAGEA